jgi:hypothetical protein
LREARPSKERAQGKPGTTRQANHQNPVQPSAQKHSALGANQIVATIDRILFFVMAGLVPTIHVLMSLLAVACDLNVIPGRRESDELRCAIAHLRISRFPDAQLRI